MRVMTVKFISLTILIISSSRFALAEDAIKPQLGLSDSFPMEAKDLPPGFQGHSVKTLYEKLISLKIPKEKSEFESIGEFRQRVELSVGKMANTTYAVAYPINSRYDLEKQKFKLGLDLDWVHIPSGSSWSFYRLNLLPFSSKKIDSYVGTNAYNVKMRVDRFEDSVYGVGLSFNERTSPGGPFSVTAYNNKPYGSFNLDVEMDVERAKAAKGQMELLLIGQLREPYVIRSLDEQNPTIDRPRDTTYVYRTVLINPVAAIVFNRQTGEIYKSIFASTEWKQRNDGGLR